VIAILQNAVEGLGLRRTCWNYVREQSLFVVRVAQYALSTLCWSNADILILNPSIDLLTIRF